MKTRLYVRLARSRSSRTGWRVDAAMKPNPNPLTEGGMKSLHTLHFALDLEMPQDIFDPRAWPSVQIRLDRDTIQQIPDEVIAVPVTPDVAAGP